MKRNQQTGLKQGVFWEDLQPFNEAISSHHSLQRMERNAPMMTGHFSFNCSDVGISLHCSDVVEKQTGTHSIELPSGLSFNLMFKGRVGFTLGCQHHFISHKDVIECTTIIINQNDLLSRHMQSGQKVKKLNLFVEKDWLLRRCTSTSDLQQINQLFQCRNQHRIIRWTASDQLISDARTLMKRQSPVTLQEKLATEQKTLTLLELLLEALFQRATDWAHSAKIRDTDVDLDPMKSITEQLLTENRTLSEVAQAFNISVSTLQRRFKKQYGMTAIDYLRHKKLEQARRDLTIEGISIGEASFKAGYNHTSNFITAFKKQFGITPRALINLHQKRGHQKRGRRD